MFLIHIVACVWFEIGIIEYQRFNSGWLVRYSVLFKSIPTQYLYSLYFATFMFTSIKGNIYPVTDSEKIYAIILAFVSILLVGVIISSIGTIMREMKSSNEAQAKKIAKFKSFLTRHNIDATNKTLV